MVLQVRLHVSFLILVCSLFLGCDNNTITQKLPQLSIKLNQIAGNFQQENGVVFNGIKPYTGYIFNLYPNSNDTLNITGYVNGKEHGVWKQFYPNGKLIELRIFVNGIKEGKYLGWWENGKKKFETQFKKGEYDGSYKEWNKDGQLTLALNYKNGYEDGTQQMFYDNGKIRSNYVIRNGRRYGLLGTKNCINVSDSIFKN